MDGDKKTESELFPLLNQIFSGTGDVENAKEKADRLLKVLIKKQAHAWVGTFVIEETKLNHPIIDGIKEKHLAFIKWAKEQIELI